MLSKPSLFLLMMFKVIKNYAERLLELTNLQRIFYVAPAGVAQLVRCHAALRGLRSIPGLARAQASAGSPFRSGHARGSSYVLSH